MTTPKTATLTELAKIAGKTKPAVLKQMRRHGVKANSKKRYNLDKALAAMALGAQLDKSKTEDDLRRMQSAGIDETNIVYKSKQAQYRKVVLQGDILEAERDKLRRNLADVDEIAAQYNKLSANAVTAAKTWKESSIAKYPTLRKEIEEIFGLLQRMMQEAVDERD